MGAAELAARIEALEAGQRRSFEEAQRSADTLFAQYQLSQLIASGGSLADLGAAVLLELIRLADAAGGALWLGGTEGGTLTRIAVGGTDPCTPPGPPPLSLYDPSEASAWSRRIPGAKSIILSDKAPRTVLVVWPPSDLVLDNEGLRIALMARHELTVAFSGARLHEILDQERQALAAIVDGATDCILQVDSEGRITLLNPAGERLLGIAEAVAIGRTCGEVLGCDLDGGHASGACPLAQVRGAGTPIAYQESVIRGVGDTSVTVAGSYAASRTGDVEVRATAILRDISAVRALEELREGFVATVSHELRTPLALIRGYAETLLHLDLDPEQQRAYVERIDEATERLALLVEEVLDVAHLEADPLILDRVTSSFASLVARLRGDLEISGGVERLRTSLPVTLPPIEVDVIRVGQILANLVGNALKYAPDGTPVVLGACPEGDWLMVTVDDEGVGIPEGERNLVTEPFHRAWNVRESRIPGTGLGLFICRRLIEAHGGSMWIEDRLDGREGTRIRFTLPLARGGPA